jgi:hypothetical protein
MLGMLGEVVSLDALAGRDDAAEHEPGGKLVSEIEQIAIRGGRPVLDRVLHRAQIVLVAVQRQGLRKQPLTIRLRT